MAALPECLRAFRAMQERFWETLYPEIELEIGEGDCGLRAGPVEWMGSRVAVLLRQAPITRSGLSYHQYKDSRSVGYEADAEASDARREARASAIAEGKITAEDFDASFRSTLKSFYVAAEESLSEAGEALDALNSFCEERYGADAPSFSRLREAIEEVKQVVGALLNEKRRLEPDVVVAESLEPDRADLNQADLDREDLDQEDSRRVQDSLVEGPDAGVLDGSAGDASLGERAAVDRITESADAMASGRRTSVGTARAAEGRATGNGRGGERPAARPLDREDAVRRVQACAEFLCAEDGSSPVSYLLQTGLRWGELRVAGGSSGEFGEANFLVAPSSDVRQQLKRLMTEANWSEVERMAVAAVGEPCGRAWLDVHRYLWRASQELGYGTLERAIVSSLQSILKDVPELPHWTFDDDTPTANAETLRWLDEVVMPKPLQPEPDAAEPVAASAASNGAASFAFAAEAPAEEEEQAVAAPDVFALAQELIAQGNAAGAIHLLAEDAARQASGRARFRSRTQAARLCVAAGYQSVAMPMLEQLAREIDERRLEGWESGELLAAPLLLLLRCMQDKDGGETASRELFARLCCIDPGAAIGTLR